MLLSASRLNLENLAADAVRRAQLGRIDKQNPGRSWIIAVTLGKSAHQVHQIGALDTEGAKIGNNLAELGALVFDGLLERRQPRNRLVGRGRHAAAEDVQLDLDAEKVWRIPS